jgi:OOP family OmpA-OmpF porin
VLKNITLLSCLVLPVTAMSANESKTIIPIQKGLTVTTALYEANQGDYESIKTLDARQGTGWRITYSAAFPARHVGGTIERINSIRFQRDSDLVKAITYRQCFESNVEEDYADTTALGASTQVLRQLKQQGKSPFRLIESVSIFPASAANDSALGLANVFTEGEAEFKGELKRIKTQTVAVIVNGRLQQLPTIVAQGNFVANGAGQVPATFMFLDDEQNPLALRWSIGKSTLSVVRIDWPQNEAVASLSQQLTQQKHISLPGLYFDFGSATLKPESTKALQTILAVLKKNSGTLRLEGHTDNIGNAAANLSLAQARVQAVRLALVKLEPALATRLVAQGFGASRPIADNRTIEGRAQNRRVELVLP